MDAIAGNATSLHLMAIRINANFDQNEKVFNDSISQMGKVTGMNFTSVWKMSS